MNRCMDGWKDKHVHVDGCIYRLMDGSTNYMKDNWMEGKRMGRYRRIDGPTYEDNGHMYHTCTCTRTCTSMFLISSYGAPLSFLFGTSQFSLWDRWLS